MNGHTVVSWQNKDHKYGKNIKKQAWKGYKIVIILSTVYPTVQLRVKQFKEILISCRIIYQKTDVQATEANKWTAFISWHFKRQIPKQFIE